MNIGFPTNTVVLIIVTMIASSAASWFILSHGLGQVPLAENVRRNWRWGAAILLIAWLLARLALAAYPPAGSGLGFQFFTTFTFLGLGLLAGILPLLISPHFQQIVRSVPETWLVGVHAVRLAGFIFLALMDMGLLPAEFALPAGYGDMTVGLLALGMIYLLSARKPYARTLLVGWNVLGLLDFAIALITGGLYILPFSAQVSASGMSLSYLNYVLVIPAFGVPLYALLHIYSLYQLTSGRMREPARKPVFKGERRSIGP